MRLGNLNFPTLFNGFIKWCRLCIQNVPLFFYGKTIRSCKICQRKTFKVHDLPKVRLIYCFYDKLPDTLRDFCCLFLLIKISELSKPPIPLITNFIENYLIFRFRNDIARILSTIFSMF